MLIVVRGEDRTLYTGYFEQLYRLRYEALIAGRGWALPSTKGCEVDQYDIDESVYIFDIGDDDSIKGTVRLTPTEVGSLTADCFPHLIESGDSPRAPDIYEATRFIVSPSVKTRKTNRIAKARVLGAMTEWCVDNQINFIQAVIDSATLSTYLELNPKVRPLGLAHPYGGGRRTPGGGECMAIRLPMTSEALDSVRAYGGLLESIPLTGASEPESVVPQATH